VREVTRQRKQRDGDKGHRWNKGKKY
jgi:hypothetical protein